jgi:3-oxoadipate enol-lactonase
LGRALVIDEAGASAPWLVLVHGMSQDHRIFDAQVDEFRSQCRILLIDLPGHGLSADIDGPFGHGEFAGHVHQRLREHVSSPIHYWGTHTGAAAGLLIAARDPDLFASLILEGPVMPGRNVQIVVSEFERVRDIARSKGAAAAVEAWWSNASWFDYIKAHPVECRAAEHYAIISDFGAQPWTDDRTPAPVELLPRTIEGLRIPTLIYNGETDHPDFLAEARNLSRLLPNAQRWITPHAGGFPAWERPSSVNARVAKFLREHIVAPP